MNGYELNNFKNNKAFIHFDGFKDGKADYGARICIDTKGNKLFELPDRDMIVNEFEDEDVAFVMKKNGLYALMNNKGEFLTDFIYQTIYGGSEEGLFEVERNGKHGHIDISGKEIIPCIYDEGNYFSEGIAGECLNGKWGMVDYFNNTVIPFEYEEICICKNNLINAKKNGKYGLINKNNEVVINFIYDEIDCWNTRECLAYPVRIADKWGLVDRQGNIVEEVIYDDCQLHSDNEDNAGEFIILQKDDKKAIYSTRKKSFITDFIYDFIGYLSENRFSVHKDNKRRFIGTNGEIITPIIYELGSDECFSEGVCVVTQDDKDGLIDLVGNLIVPCIYKKLHSCKEGLILATDSDGNNGYINNKGQIIIPFGKYTSFSDYSCGLAKVYNNKYEEMYIDKTDKILEIEV